MGVQTSKHAAEFDMSLWRNFLLVLEEQHLVIEKCLPNLCKLLSRYTVGQLYAANLRAQVGREG